MLHSVASSLVSQHRSFFLSKVGIVLGLFFDLALDGVGIDHCGYDIAVA